MRRSSKEDTQAPLVDGGSKPTPSLQDYTIRIVPDKDAARWARWYHYLHRARTSRVLSYGIFLGEELEGFITYAHPATTSVLGLNSEVLEFARLFLFHNIPNMASRFISLTRRWIRRDWVKKFPGAATPVCIVSWSDTTRHEGTIYKASGFKAIGLSKEGKWGKWGDRTRSGPRKDYLDGSHPKEKYIYWWNE